MSRRLTARISFLIVMLFALLTISLLYVDKDASAQRRPRPTVTVAVTVTASPEIVTNVDRADIAVGFLIFGGVALALAIALLMVLGLRFYTAVEKTTTTTGEVPPVKEQDIFLRTAVEVLGLTGEAAGIRVAGPPTVIVGEETEFIIENPDGSEPTGTASWGVDPSDIADIISAEGTKARVKAKKAGRFQVAGCVEEHGQANPAPAASSTDVEATEPEPEPEPELEEPASSGGLPFLGAGFGTIVIAILLLTIVGSLALMGVLSGEAVATLFGAALGYIFGKGLTGSGEAQSGPVPGKKNNNKKKKKKPRKGGGS